MSYVSILESGQGVAAPVQRRVGTFLLVLAGHIGLIILLVLTRQVEPQPRQRGSLSMFALAAAAPLAQPVPVIIPILPAKAKPANPDPAEAFAEQQSAEGDPDGEICSALEHVTAQLVSDPVVPLAIDRVLPSDRSVSEAIVMWNAEWSPVAAAEEAPLAEVRSRVLLILESLPPDCLAMPVIGPRLIAIPENGYTTFLAFGSGEWSWQQLVEPPDDAVTTENDAWTWEDLFADNIPPTLF